MRRATGYDAEELASSDRQWGVRCTIEHITPFRLYCLLPMAVFTVGTPIP